MDPRQGTASLHIVAAGPHVSFQDGGRRAHMRYGVPASGPMDRLAHAAANLAIGNDADATAIEVSRAGLVLACRSGPVTVAVTGGSFGVALGDTAVSPWTAFTVAAGDHLSIRPGDWGSWAYLAVAGVLDVAAWLGHTATHSLSGLGGGMLAAGHDIDVIRSRTDAARQGEIPIPAFARPTGRARVVMGPQDEHFRDESVEAFLNTPFVLTDAYDRMGVRLRGRPLRLRSSVFIPSEPIVRGSVQIAGDGVPTVLLADHQTTGGYPRIATVISADIDGVAQLRSGDTIRFAAVEATEAIDIVRARAMQAKGYLHRVAGPGRTLTHRLLGENLIGGVVSASPE